MRVLAQKALMSPTRIFSLIWMVGTGHIVNGVGVFPRNQIRPIQRPAEAGYPGKGRDIPNFRLPVTEVRSAAAIHRNARPH